MKYYKLFMLLSVIGLAYLPCITTAQDGTTGTDHLYQSWVLDKVEEFDQQYDPKEGQQEDYINFTEDGKMEGKMEGVERKGPWDWQQGNTYIMVEDKVNNERIRLKLIELERDKLVLEHQKENLVRTHYIYRPAP